jgi:hypothetical protein
MKMADFVSDLAGKCGISPDQARQGMAAVISLLQDKVPGDTVSSLKSAANVTEQDIAEVDARAAAPQASGGMLGTIAGMAAKYLGEGGLAAGLLTKLTALGFTPDQIATFGAVVLQNLKGRVPDEVLAQLSSLLPGKEPARA